MAVKKRPKKQSAHLRRRAGAKSAGKTLCCTVCVVLTLCVGMLAALYHFGSFALRMRMEAVAVAWINTVRTPEWMPRLIINRLNQELKDSQKSSKRVDEIVVAKAKADISVDAQRRKLLNQDKAKSASKKRGEEEKSQRLQKLKNPLLRRSLQHLSNHQKTPFQKVSPLSICRV